MRYCGDTNTAHSTSLARPIISLNPLNSQSSGPALSCPNQLEARAIHSFISCSIGPPRPCKSNISPEITSHSLRTDKSVSFIISF